MGIFKSKRKKREEQALRLKQAVETGQTRSPAGGQRILAWGRGILEEQDRTLGPHVTDSVFVFTNKALYYQFLEETPKELWSPRAMASGASPLEWKQVAKDSTDFFDFSKLQASDARQAVDGRWDLLFVPFRAMSEFDIKGFGVIESYGGRSPEELARFVAENLPRG